jgi:TMEM175 potassium channel family protein
VSKGRLEAFSDGIFAIAITLLVLTIAQPNDFHRLGHELSDRIPSFGAYVVSFIVIGIMWFNHHSVFTHFAKVDRGLVFCNLLLLMTIAFLPYPTQVFGAAIRDGAGERAAAVFYSATMAVNAVAWAILWLYASTGRRLLAESFPEHSRRSATIAFTAGTFAYLAAVAVAFVSPVGSLALQGGFAIYYALDPLTRRAQRRQSVRN